MTERPPIHSGAQPATITVLIGASVSEPERLLLIAEPENGVARIREWTSADWSATPEHRESPVESLYEDVELAAKSGRSVNVDLLALRQFLGVR